MKPFYKIFFSDSKKLRNKLLKEEPLENIYNRILEKSQRNQ